MSNVKAYICDYCEKIKEEDEIHGIKPLVDCIDKLNSFKNEKASKCEIHFCIDCYREQVIDPAEKNSNRKEDEYAYKLLMRELSYGFKQTCFLRRYSRLSKKKA